MAKKQTEVAEQEVDTTGLDDCFGKFRDMSTPECQACTVNKQCGEAMDKNASPEPETTQKKEDETMATTPKTKKTTAPKPPAKVSKKKAAVAAKPEPEPVPAPKGKKTAKTPTPKPAPKKAEPKKAEPKKATPKKAAPKPKNDMEPKVSKEEASWISELSVAKHPTLQASEKKLQDIIQAKMKDVVLTPKEDKSAPRYLRVSGGGFAYTYLRGNSKGLTVVHRWKGVWTGKPEDVLKGLKQVPKD